MSAHQVAFTFVACSDVKHVWESIAMPADPWGAEVAQKLAAAERFSTGLARHCEILAANPDVGVRRDEVVHGLRSSPFERYTLFYRVRGHRIEVVRVLRTERDVPQSGA